MNRHAYTESALMLLFGAVLALITLCTSCQKIDSQGMTDKHIKYINNRTDTVEIHCNGSVWMQNPGDTINRQDHSGNTPEFGRVYKVYVHRVLIMEDVCTYVNIIR